MVAPTLVKITLYDPDPNGDAGTPFVGRAGLKPSLERHIEGETPPDYVVTDKRFFVTFGDLLGVNPATPGVAWVYLEPTDYGPYADAWGWEVCFFRPGQADNQCGECHTYAVPTSGTTVDFGDLVQLDPEPPSPGWIAALNQEIARAEAAEADLQDQINAIISGDLVAVATDGSFGLGLPTGVGFEAVITGDALQDFRFDGVDL